MIFSYGNHELSYTCFPLTPALSLGERELISPVLEQYQSPEFIECRSDGFPLPTCHAVASERRRKGEGRGEGEQSVAYPIASTVASQPFIKKHHSCCCLALLSALAAIAARGSETCAYGGGNLGGRDHVAKLAGLPTGETLLLLAKRPKNR